MPGYQNLHTHTTYVDGTLPPEAMIEAALKKGCDSIGFSEHSYVPFDDRYSMSPDAALEYVREINALRDKYEGTIEVFIGVEHDYCTTVPVQGLDYRIGSAHYVKRGDEYVTVDAGADHQKQIANEYFGGDYYAMAEAYFETVAGIIDKADIDIIGHFDLIAKYNFDGSLFDETRPRYRSAALEAMDMILKRCRLFEVNTGMLYRYGKQEPYPSVFLLKELQTRSGEVILSSDSHDAQSLCYKFREMLVLLKACGFKYIKRLTKSGFIDIII
ncbi:MAG: histidinol-phosphatase HisJ family protein [Oscillospiraceae bacterium]|nr:histidinol-phosphatase HisJ family protein [Oscillospiraceae bacterium]